jgi:hypothetical protein
VTGELQGGERVDDGALVLVLARARAGEVRPRVGEGVVAAQLGRAVLGGARRGPSLPSE